MKDKAHTLDVNLGEDLRETLITMRALIAAGRGDEPMQLKARHGDEAEARFLEGLSGTVGEVYAKLVAIAQQDPKLAQEVRRLEENASEFEEPEKPVDDAIRDVMFNDVEARARVRNNAARIPDDMTRDEVYTQMVRLHAEGGGEQPVEISVGHVIDNLDKMIAEGRGEEHVTLNARRDDDPVGRDLSGTAREVRAELIDFLREAEVKKRETLSEDLGVRGLKQLIAEGRGEEHVTLYFKEAPAARHKATVTAEDWKDRPGAQFEGPVYRVCRELIDTLKRDARKLYGNVGQDIIRLQQDAKYRDYLTSITGSTDAYLQEQLARCVTVRDQLLAEDVHEFAEEAGMLSGLGLRITSMLQEAAPVADAGAGKIRVLEDRRLPRIPGTEIRDLPLADKIAARNTQLRGMAAGQPGAKELNAEVRGMLQQMTGQPMGKVLEQLMEENFPELMKAFYPRIYENIGRYHSPRACAAAMVNIMAETLRYGYHKTATAYRLALPGLRYLRDKRVPMFFLAPDLLEAVMRTDFDDDINWRELQLPFETGLLMLPKGSLVHPDDGECAMIMWSRLRQGEHPPPCPGIPVSVLPHDAFVMLGLCPEKCMWYDSILTANVLSTLRIRNLFSLEPGQAAPNIQKSNFMDEDLNEADSAFAEKMGVILFGTILAMNARPLLVEHGRFLKRVGKADKAREFWSPNIIGARYKFKREVPRIAAGKFVQDARQHGTHASPRMHWRRGHYRNQPYGPKLKEHKTIWIEPCLIGAEG